MKIEVKKLNKNAKLPYRATAGSAGADLFACIERDIVIESGQRVLISTGIAVEIPENGYGGFVFARSSVASRYGVSLSNCVGVIDSDYRGEVKIPIINHGQDAYTVKNGDRIAQLMFMPVYQAAFLPVDELDETERGTGGFGSTGVN